MQKSVSLVLILKSNWKWAEMPKTEVVRKNAYMRLSQATFKG